MPLMNNETKENCVHQECFWHSATPPISASHSHNPPTLISSENICLGKGYYPTFQGKTALVN